jgi:hypothetical protein
VFLVGTKTTIFFNLCAAKSVQNLENTGGGKWFWEEIVALLFLRKTINKSLSNYYPEKWFDRKTLFVFDKITTTMLFFVICYFCYFFGRSTG